MKKILLVIILSVMGTSFFSSCSHSTNKGMQSPSATVTKASNIELSNVNGTSSFNFEATPKVVLSEYKNLSNTVP